MQMHEHIHEKKTPRRRQYTYASQTPLDVIGTFHCETAVGDNSVDAEFCVIRGKGESPLGRETDMSLGVLKMGVHVAAVNTGSRTLVKFYKINTHKSSRTQAS